MGKLRIIFSMVVFPALAFASKDASLLSDLKKRIGSPKSALDYVYSDSKKWNAYLEHIKEAETEWLKLWPALRKVSDAGATEQLDISFGSVLEKKPTVALAEIKHAWSDDKEMKGVVGRVCASVSETLSDRSLGKDKEKTEALKMIAARLKKLSQVEDKDLLPLKELCIEELKKEEVFWQKK